MKIPRSLPLGVSLLALAFATPARSSEVHARAIVDSALTALGGRLRLEAYSSWEVAGKGRENLSAEVQGITPDLPTWRPHEEQLTVDARTMSVAWQRKTPRNDESVRWRRLIYRPDSSGYVDFVVGQGGLRPSPASELRRRSLARRIPHLLVLEAATRAQLFDRGPVTIGRRAGDQVGAILDGDTLVLSFTRSPMVLRRVEFHRNQPTRGDVTIAWSWDDWQKDPYLGYVPRGHRVEVDGTLFQEVHYSRYEAPPSDARSRMGVADAKMYWKPPKASRASNVNVHVDGEALPDTGEVGRGVHVGRFAGFTVMWVEFSDFLVAIEAPDASPGLEAIPPDRPAARPTDDFIARLQRQYPGKPVRYVVVSHHHGDHMGGIRSFAELGATVVVAPGHRAAAERALAGLGRPQIMTVADRHVIEEAGRRLEIINVGRNPHTAENLMVWLPSDRIVFQGDLFYDDGMTFPPSGRGRMNHFTAQWLKARSIAPRAIYGVHNDAPSPAERLVEALKIRE